jgi:hypothetical protein
MPDDEDQNIGFQDPDQEDMPSEMKDHWLAAFGHAAGQNPHPGPYKGPKRKARDPDEPTESDRESARQEEANAQKMRAAQMGAPEAAAIGPTPMEQAQVKQSGAISKEADLQAAQQAAQAQGAQAPVNAPPAPSGPAGATIPFPAQKGAVGGPGNAPQPSQAAPPPAPPPDGGEEEEDPSTKFPP